MSSLTRESALEVTLRSIDSLDEFPERKILLTPNSKISIGRASKNAYKNLRSSPSNAFIDSPVVSRDHAIISANSSCGVRDPTPHILHPTNLFRQIPTVYIKDSGSMHGTLVNKARLEKNKDHQLKNGDILQFGTDVHRDNGELSRFMFSQPLSIIAYLSKLVCLAWNTEANTFQFAETFIAQKFRFESRPAASSATEETTVSRTYSVPEADTSDEEEESEDDSSIAEVSDHESLSSLPEKPSSSSEALKSPSSPTEGFSTITPCGFTNESDINRLGSQSNPVNIADDGEVNTQTKFIFIDIEDEEEPASESQNDLMPKNKSEIGNIPLTEGPNGDKPTMTTAEDKAKESKDVTEVNDNLSDYHEDESDAGCGHDSERVASASPRSYRFQSYMENLEDESDYEERRSMASDLSNEDIPGSVDVELDYDSEASEMEAEMEGETTSHVAPFENLDETNQENSGADEDSLNNSSELGAEFDIASLASDELEDCASESSDDEADAACRLKMIEMLNDVRQKTGCAGSVPTAAKPPPSLLSPPNSSLAPVENITKNTTEPLALNVPTGFSQTGHTNRSSAVSMSLRNIMLSEKDQATDTCILSKEPANKASNGSPINRSAPANSWSPPKNLDMKHVDLGHIEFFGDMFEQPFPGTCRPAAPKPLQWNGDSIRDNNDLNCLPYSFSRDGSFLGWNEAPNTSPARFNYPPLPYSDYTINSQPGDRPAADSSTSFNRPTYDPNYSSRSAKPFNSYLSSSLPHNTPTYPRSDALPTSSSTPVEFQKWTADRKSNDFVSQYQPVKLSSSEPVVKASTPGPQSLGETPKPKTGMSIPEIVEDNSLQATTPRTSHKRKADAMEHEDEEALPVEIPSTLQQEMPIDLPSESSEAVAVAQPIALEPPRKKMRLQFAATAMAGAVVGGLTMLATLISLPDTFFQ